MRQTSIAAYAAITSNGLIKGRQLEVYCALYEAGPMSQVETVRYLQSKKRDITDHGFTPRFSELRRMGVIEEIRERKCSVTGMNVIEWAVTDKLPEKLEKTVPMKKQIEILKNRISELEGMLNRCTCGSQSTLPGF